MGLLLGREFGQGHGGEAGIAMAMEFGLRPRWAVCQARKLFGIPEQKRDVEARFVIPVDGQRRQRHVGAKEHRRPLGTGIYDDHHMQVPLPLDMIHDGVREHDRLLWGRDTFPASQVC